MRVFVTASGTGVGKTHVMCALVAMLGPKYRLRVIKPVATGFDESAIAASDTGRLLLAQNLPLSAANVASVSPWRFAAPLSPDMAAAREHRAIVLDDVIAFCERSNGSQLTLIEGVGGVMVPLDARATVLDWIERLAPRVLLVTGSYLGTLSHTLTAAAALRARGVALAGIVVSESAEQPVPLAETVETLARFASGIAVVALPRAPALDARTGAALAALVLEPPRKHRVKAGGHEWPPKG